MVDTRDLKSLACKACRFDSDRGHQFFDALIAQLVEQGFCKAQVAGSNPAQGSIFFLTTSCFC